MNGQNNGSENSLAGCGIEDDEGNNVAVKPRDNSCCYGGARPKSKQNQVGGFLNGYSWSQCHREPKSYVNGDSTSCSPRCSNAEPPANHRVPPAAASTTISDPSSSLSESKPGESECSHAVNDGGGGNSSDSADESVDDQCIYTFKGDTGDVSVFPDSFYLNGLMHDGLSNGKCLNPAFRSMNPDRNQYSNVFSPDMDFLEMDFDPGSGNNNDSDVAECGDDSGRSDEDDDDGGEFSCDRFKDGERFKDDLPLPPPPSLPLVNRCFPEIPLLQPCQLKGHSDAEDIEERDKYQKRRRMKDFFETTSSSTNPKCNGTSESNPETPHDKNCGKIGSSLVKSWSFHGSLHTGKQQYPLQCLKTKDDFEVSPTSKDFSPSEFRTQEEGEPLLMCGEWLDRRENSLFTPRSELSQSVRSFCFDPTSPSITNFNTAEKVMIWNESEACMKHIRQLGVSACGATAIANTLLALEVPFVIDEVMAEVRTKLRAEDAPIPEYLFSRSVAGCTPEELIRAVGVLTKGKVKGRFFSMNGRSKSFRLGSWLKLWISMGAVPVLTLNLQQAMMGKPLADAWHHQMVFGVGPRGIYLTNELECMTEEELWPKLSSNSELLIRRADIVSRWGEGCDMKPLIHPSRQLWIRYNVLGQVVKVLREEKQVGSSSSHRQVTPFVRIPAAYKAGVTLFACDTAASKLLNVRDDKPTSASSS